MDVEALKDLIEKRVSILGAIKTSWEQVISKDANYMHRGPTHEVVLINAGLPVNPRNRALVNEIAKLKGYRHTISCGWKRYSKVEHGRTNG